MLDFLRTQNISEKLIGEIVRFREFYQCDDEVRSRVPKPRYRYYGKEVWEMAIVAILEGEHILLSGAKATGKNVLADNLAAAFGRPAWNVSFNVNTDSSSLIGTDTFADGRVQFRRGMVYETAIHGGFGILDEINMAKNDAVAVLHSALDYRRIIDVPGYDKVALNEATRFIATMNYGYVGTRELNEALVSRFMVIDIPPLTRERLGLILDFEIGDLKEEYKQRFVDLFLDLQLKFQNSELSGRAVDLRGLLAAIRSIKRGLSPSAAIRMGITDKTFDPFEKELVEDVIVLHLPKNADGEAMFS